MHTGLDNFITSSIYELTLNDENVFYFNVILGSRVVNKLLCIVDKVCNRNLFGNN